MSRRKRMMEELDQDIRDYIERETQDNIARGMSPEEARYAALRKFGNVTRVKEETWEVWSFVWLDQLWQDLRFGLRQLRRSPGFTAVSVLTLALGIGANTAIFSVVDSLLFRPLPVKDPGQVHVLTLRQKNGPVLAQFSIADFRDLQQQTAEVFSGVIGYLYGMDGLSVSGRADRVLTNYVSGNYFSMLGIQPEIGRFILPSDGEGAGAAPVMVLSHAYWKQHFGGDPDIVGRKVSVDGHPVTIVGVAPPGFYGVSPFLHVEGYLPLGLASQGGYPGDIASNRASRNLSVLGRLRPGVSLPQAQASLGVVAQRLAQQYPATDSDLSFQAFPELRARPNPDPDNTMLILSGLFLALAAMVLVLACVNVANITLVRATARETEMAIRLALGARRARLVRQLLTESLVLALAGGLAGILLGSWGSATLGSLNFHTDLPIHIDFGFDWRVFSYALGAALLTGLLVGVAPAIRASRSLGAVLHAGGRGIVGHRQRLRSALVVVQVGGSLMLLIVAGLFARSLVAAQRTDLGFDPNHVLNFSMDPNEIGYNEAQSRAFYKTLLERVRALPGVESASTAVTIPMGYIYNGDTLTIPGYQESAGQPAPFALYNTVSPGYFETLRIPLVRGRAFTDADGPDARYVAIVSQAMAKRFWPNQDPVGRTFKMLGDQKQDLEVIGVAKDARYQGVTGTIDPFFYVPFAQHPVSNSLEALQVRTVGPPESVLPEIQRVIASLAPELPVFDTKTMTQALNTLNGFLIFQLGAGLAAALGILGLVLALVGVYGVVAYAVSKRTHEIGIRTALGAEQGDILKMIFRQGLFIVGAGLGVGLAGAFAASRVVGDFIAVSPTDPFTYLAVSGLLTVVALLACYVPARRAAKVDPMVALRYE
jgi:predicted permease